MDLAHARSAWEASLAAARDADLQRLRQLIHDLRNPVGAVGVAVEMLIGPLRAALDKLEAPMAQRVESTLSALLESVRQLRHLVASVDQVPSKRPPVREVAANDQNATPSPSRRKSEGSAGWELLRVEELLRRLEILTVTRSALPALLAVDAESGLVIHAQGPELLRGLSNIVENAIEASAAADPGPGPWTIEIAAYGTGKKDVCIEVRNRGVELSDEVLCWLADRNGEVEPPRSTKTDGGLHGLGLVGARRVAEQFGGKLEAERIHGITVMRLRMPRPHTTSAAPAEEAYI